MVQLKDTLDKITVADFVDFPKKKDPAMLVIEGEPTPEEIQSCWFGLLSQYYKATGNEQMGEHVRKGARADYLTYRVETVQNCVTFIRQTISDTAALDNKEEIYKELAPLFDILRHFGYNMAFEPGAVLKELDKVITGEKKHMIELARLQSWIKKQSETAVDDGDTNFYRQMAEVRKFEGYNTPHRQLAKIMTMAEYCESYVRMKEHIEYLKSKQHGEGE